MLKITNPRVLAVKHRYENPTRGPKRTHTPFEDMYRYYSNPDLSYIDIAEIIGTTKQNVHQTFEIFKPIMPGNLQSGFDRRKLRTKRGYETKAERFKNQDLDSATGILKTMLDRRRISCRRIFTKDGFKKHYAYVRDYLCYVLVCTQSRKYSKQTVCKHFHFPVSNSAIKKVDFVILIAQTSERADYYILPKNKLDVPEGKTKNFYVKDVTTPSIIKQRVTPNTIFFEDHRNAWPLIRKASD